MAEAANLHIYLGLSLDDLVMVAAVTLLATNSSLEMRTCLPLPDSGRGLLPVARDAIFGHYGTYHDESGEQLNSEVDK
jgi:hypothetical protein